MLYSYNTPHNNIYYKPYPDDYGDVYFKTETIWDIVELYCQILIDHENKFIYIINVKIEIEYLFWSNYDNYHKHQAGIKLFRTIPNDKQIFENLLLKFFDESWH